MSRPGRSKVANGPLIKAREPGRLTDLARVILLGALVALPAFLYATLQANLHQQRRSVVELEEQLGELEGQRRRLEVELASLRDPRRVREVAAGALGMVDAEPDQIVYLTLPPRAVDQPATLVAAALGEAHGRQRP
jgi:cell division protein FtsL